MNVTILLPYFVPCQRPQPRIGPVQSLPVLQAQGELYVSSLIAVCPEQYFVFSLSLDTVSHLNSLSLSRLTNPTRHESWGVLPSEQMSDKCSSIISFIRSYFLGLPFPIHSYFLKASLSPTRILFYLFKDSMKIQNILVEHLTV